MIDIKTIIMMTKEIHHVKISKYSEDVVESFTYERHELNCINYEIRYHCLACTNLDKSESVFPLENIFWFNVVDK